MMKTLQKRVFSPCWTPATSAFAFICVSRANFKNWWWKHCKNAFLRNVEHLRLLHMAIFAFLEQISKIDDENSSKRVFSPCWTLATTAYAFICVSRANFKNWWWKQCKNAFFRHVEHLRLLHMPLFAFLEGISKLIMKTVQKRVFRHVEHLWLLHMPYLRFWSNFQKLMMKTMEKRVFRHDEHLWLLHMPHLRF